MGCARAPASLLADVDDEADDEVELPVFELEPDPDVVDEPEPLPLVVEPPVVPPVVPLVLLPPDVVPLVLEPPEVVPLVVPLVVAPEPDVVPVEGDATGTRVELTPAAADGT